MKSLIAMSALSAAAILAAQPASAQLAKHAKGPIDIAGDQAEMHNADCTQVWTGSPEALQDSSRLRANVMIAHMEMTKKGKPTAAAQAGSTNACGDLLSLEVKGSVYFLSSDGRRVHGDNGFYDAATTTVTITGDVTAVDGQNVMRGTKMVYNTQTGDGHVEGSGTGPTSKTRPRGVFYPKDTDKSGDETQGEMPKKAAK